MAACLEVALGGQYLGNGQPPLFKILAVDLHQAHLAGGCHDLLLGNRVSNPLHQLFR